MEKQKRKLTKKLIESLKPASKLYRVWDTDIHGFNLKVRPTGSMSFSFFYRVAGKQSEYTIGKYGSLTADEARTEAKSLAGKASTGNDVQVEKKMLRKAREKAASSTLSAFIKNKYKPWVLQERKSGQATLDMLELHFSYLNDYQLDSITAWVVTKWRSERLKQEVIVKPAKGKAKPVVKTISSKTVNRNIAALKSVLSKAVEWKIVGTNPLKDLKQLKVDDRTKKRFLSDAEELILRDALSAREQEKKQARDSANDWRTARKITPMNGFDNNQFFDHIKPMVLLMLNTGIRPGEMFQITWGDVDLKAKRLEVRGEISKGGRSRTIPLNNEALGTLIQWKNQKNAKLQLVFPSPKNDDEDCKMDKLPKALERLIGKAGIKNFRPYDLRHTFASNLVMQGIDLNTVRELLGHEDISTTMIYAHLSPEHKASAVAVLERQLN